MNFDQLQAPIAEVREYRPRIEKAFKGSLRVRPGHVIFKFSFKTGILERVDMTEVPKKSVATTPQYSGVYSVGVPVEVQTTRYSMQSDSDTIVFSCLNLSSAMKKLNRLGITTFNKVS